MARKIQWLEFISQKDRARREEASRRRYMPKGDEQRAAEVKLLRAVVHTRADDTDLIFQLVQAKQCLDPDEDIADEAEASAERSAELREWLRSPLARRFSRSELAAFWALAEAELAMSGFDAALLPSAEALSQRAARLTVEHRELF